MSKPGKIRGVFERPPGSNIWWIDYTANGRRHREKIGPKAAAIAVYQQRMTEIRLQKFDVTRVRQQTLVKQLLERYADHFAGLRSPGQHLRHRRIWEEHLGDWVASDVKPGDIRSVLRKRSKILAPATVNRELSYLSKVFSLACQDEVVERNPCKLVSKLKERNQRLRWLTEAEEEQLRGHFKPADWEIVELAILTGLRKSELFSLRRSDFDPNRGWIHVRERKGGLSQDLPVSTRAAAIIAERLARHSHDYLFESKNPKKPKDSHNWYIRFFQPAVAAAGLTDVVFHTMRHTFCSRLVMAGVNLATVQRLAGHKTIEMTNRYSHLAPDYMKAEVEKLAPKTTPTPTTLEVAAWVNRVLGRLAAPGWGASWGKFWWRTGDV